MAPLVSQQGNISSEEIEHFVCSSDAKIFIAIKLPNNL